MNSATSTPPILKSASSTLRRLEVLRVGGGALPLASCRGRPCPWPWSSRRSSSRRPRPRRSLRSRRSRPRGGASPAARPCPSRGRRRGSPAPPPRSRCRTAGRSTWSASAAPASRPSSPGRAKARGQASPWGQGRPRRSRGSGSNRPPDQGDRAGGLVEAEGLHVLRLLRRDRVHAQVLDGAQEAVDRPAAGPGGDGLREGPLAGVRPREGVAPLRAGHLEGPHVVALDVQEVAVAQVEGLLVEGALDPRGHEEDRVGVGDRPRVDARAVRRASIRTGGERSFAAPRPSAVTVRSAACRGRTPRGSRPARPRLRPSRASRGSSGSTSTADVSAATAKGAATFQPAPSFTSRIVSPAAGEGDLLRLRLVHGEDGHLLLARALRLRLVLLRSTN